MVAVKVAAFYRFRPAAARNASVWATRGPSVGEPLAETGAAAPAARNGPLCGAWPLGDPRGASGPFKCHYPRDSGRTHGDVARMRALRERERRGRRRLTIGVSEDDLRVIAMSAGALTLEASARCLASPGP